MSDTDYIKKMALDLLVASLETEADGCCVPSRLGNQLGLPVVNFFTLLRQTGVLYREGIKGGSGKNMPTEEALASGIVRVEQRDYKGEMQDQILLTPLGIRNIAGYFLDNPTPAMKCLAMALCIRQGWAPVPGA